MAEIKENPPASVGVKKWIPKNTKNGDRKIKILLPETVTAIEIDLISQDKIIALLDTHKDFVTQYFELK